MEVILTQDVDGVGKAGAVIKAKDGYARNFLFARNLALPANPANLKKLEQINLKKQQESEKLKDAALEFKKKIESVSITIPALTQEEDKEKLYGSINAQVIHEALKDEGIDVEKSLIVLEEPIKALGIFEIPVKLHPEVQAKAKIWVVKK